MYVNLDIPIADEEIVDNVESPNHPVSPVNKGTSNQAMVSSNKQQKNCLGEKEPASPPKDDCSPNNGSLKVPMKRNLEVVKIDLN